MTVQPVERVLRRVLLLRPTPERWAQAVPPVQATVQPVVRLLVRPKVGALPVAQLLEQLLAARPSFAGRRRRRFTGTTGHQ